jgi:ATP-dependent DNA helicase RecQ
LLSREAAETARALNRLFPDCFWFRHPDAPFADENCGHCHFCRTGIPAEQFELPATPIAEFTEAGTEEIRALIFEEIPSLSTPRQLTRFLCGLTGPATSRAKLTKRPEFGRYATTPFRTVLAQVEACWEEVG